MANLAVIHDEHQARLEVPPAQAASALSTIAAWRGTVLNHEHPILETELPIDGSRFEGIVSPVVRRPIFAIRLRPRRIFPLEEYESAGILRGKDDPLNHVRRQDDFLNAARGLKHADVIRAAVRAKKNILVVGSTDGTAKCIMRRMPTPPSAGTHLAKCATVRPYSLIHHDIRNQIATRTRRSGALPSQ
jgi:hypothetical protein